MPEGDACRLPDRSSPDETIRRIFALKTIAVVGCSPKPERAGHYVPEYLKEQGYRIVPVNPGHQQILGETCYPSLEAIPFPVDLVLVFRRPEEALEPILGAIAKKAKAVWLQDGITHPQGEETARKAGLLVVSDDCMLRRHRSMGGA